MFFAPLFVFAYLLAWAGGGPALVARRLARPDGTHFTAWRFNVCGRSAKASPKPMGRGRFGTFGRFLYRTRLEVLPSLYCVARGHMTLAELFQDR